MTALLLPLNENTVRTEGIQITLYFIMSSISLVKKCCVHENMVHGMHK